MKKIKQKVEIMSDELRIGVEGMGKVGDQVLSIMSEK